MVRLHQPFTCLTCLSLPYLSIYSLRSSPQLSLAPFHRFRATLCETFGLGTDLAAIEGSRSGITSKQPRFSSLFVSKTSDLLISAFRCLCVLSILISNVQISQVLLCPNQHRRIDLGSPHRCSPASSHAGRHTSTNVGPFLEAWSGRRPWQ